MTVAHQSALIPLSSALSYLAALLRATLVADSAREGWRIAITSTFSLLARGDLVATEAVRVPVEQDPQQVAEARAEWFRKMVYYAAGGFGGNDTEEPGRADLQLLRTNTIASAGPRFPVPTVVWKLASAWPFSPNAPVYDISTNVAGASVAFVGGQIGIVFGDRLVLGRPGGGALRADWLGRHQARAQPWAWVDLRVDSGSFLEAASAVAEGRPLTPPKSPAAGPAWPPPGGLLPTELPESQMALLARFADLDAILARRAGIQPEAIQTVMELHAADLLLAWMVEEQAKGNNRARQPELRARMQELGPPLRYREFSRLWITSLTHPSVDNDWRASRPTRAFPRS